MSRASLCRLAAHGGARRAFTLLELIVVMAIIAVITAAIIPIYSSALVAVQLRNARAEFLSVLYHTQERAVAESREYRLYMNDKDGAYWVEYVSNDMGKKHKETEEVTEEFGRYTLLPSYLKFDRLKARKNHGETTPFIGCYPNGACDRASVILKDLRSSNRRTRITVLGTMGKVEVKDMEHGDE